MSGLRPAVLYGIKPHQLGFCGPQNKSRKILFDYIEGKKISGKKVRRILEGFEAAYSYYKLIAKSNNIKDPLDEQVVRAYWIGNNLLDKVKIHDLRKMIANEFFKPRLLPKNSKPHHSFHVLVIGSITGRIELKGRLLDLCRVSWGRVEKIKDKKLKVTYKPLKIKRKIILGEPMGKEIEWNKNSLSNVKIGDWVSFHWDQAVEILTDEDIKNLKKYTLLTINSL